MDLAFFFLIDGWHHHLYSKTFRVFTLNVPGKWFHMYNFFWRILKTHRGGKKIHQLSTSRIINRSILCEVSTDIWNFHLKLKTGSLNYQQYCLSLLLSKSYILPDLVMKSSHKWNSAWRIENEVGMSIIKTWQVWYAATRILSGLRAFLKVIITCWCKMTLRFSTLLCLRKVMFPAFNA